MKPTLLFLIHECLRTLINMKKKTNLKNLYYIRKIISIRKIIK